MRNIENENGAQHDMIIDMITLYSKIKLNVLNVLLTISKAVI